MHLPVFFFRPIEHRLLTKVAPLGHSNFKTFSRAPFCVIWKHVLKPFTADILHVDLAKFSFSVLALAWHCNFLRCLALAFTPHCTPFAEVSAPAKFIFWLFYNYCHPALSIMTEFPEISTIPGPAYPYYPYVYSTCAQHQDYSSSMKHGWGSSFKTRGWGPETGTL